MSDQKKVKYMKINAVSLAKLMEQLGMVDIDDDKVPAEMKESLELARQMETSRPVMVTDLEDWDHTTATVQ